MHCTARLQLQPQCIEHSTSTHSSMHCSRHCSMHCNMHCSMHCTALLHCQPHCTVHCTRTATCPAAFTATCSECGNTHRCTLMQHATCGPAPCSCAACCTDVTRPASLSAAVQPACPSARCWVSCARCNSEGCWPSGQRGVMCQVHSEGCCPGSAVPSAAGLTATCEVLSVKC